MIGIQSWGQGHPLVLLHGWGFDRQIWQPVIPLLMALSKPLEIIVVDLPGFGRTPGMSWAEFKAELILQLPNPCSILGWSLGGLFATRWAIEEPHRVSSLMNIASSPYFIQEDNWAGIKQTSLEQFYEQFYKNPLKTRKEFVKAQIQAMTLPPMMEVYDSISLEGLKQGLDILTHWDLRPVLEHLKMPVFYLFGRLDTIVPRKLMAIMQEKYPKFHYHLEHQAAHMPFLSHPKVFTQFLETALTHIA